MTPDERKKIELEAMLAETVGETNKTQEQVDREFEQSIISQFPPAPNLQGQAPEPDTDVAIPQVVKDALDESIKNGEFPLGEEFIRWLELKTAEFNGVDPEYICAHPKICQKGKMWDYYPEVADRFTGFTYFLNE
jgi:hypothetical protein